MMNLSRKKTRHSLADKLTTALQLKGVPFIAGNGFQLEHLGGEERGGGSLSAAQTVRGATVF